MLKDYKILVKDEEESKEVQEMLFKLGYKWKKGGAKPMYLTSPVLTIYADGDICYGLDKSGFEIHENEELTVAQLKKMVGVVGEQGVKYDSDKQTYNPLVAQEGGGHYKNRGIQPIEYSEANNLGACQHSIVKYITRHQDKNGVEDLSKIIHFTLLEAYFKYGEEGSTELRNKVLKLLGVNE